VISVVLLLREVSLESGISGSSISQSGSSSTIGTARRKDGMPEEVRGRRGVRDMERLCKGSTSHSAAILGACPLSEYID
jgi:hypothetical protein